MANHRMEPTRDRIVIARGSFVTLDRKDRMAKTQSTDIRELILTVAVEQQPKHQSEPALCQTTLLEAVVKRLGRPNDREFEQAILTQWHDLVRTGYFAWGLDINNPNPPFFHFTEHGRRALERLGRDPGNPAGYLRHLSTVSTLNPIANSMSSRVSTAL